MKATISAASLIGLISTAGALADVLTTTFAGGGSNHGQMFDVVATKSLTVDAFQFAFQSAGTSEVDIYTKSGTYDGFEGNAAAWTLVASASVTASVADVALAPFHLSVPVSIPAGARRAFYVRRAGGSSLSDSTGTGVAGSLVTADTNLRIFEGISLSGLFGAVFLPRVPNIRIHYTPVVPTDRASPVINVIGKKKVRTTESKVTIFGLVSDDASAVTVKARYNVNPTRKVTRTLTPGANGLFKLKVKTFPGSNPVRFTAIDTAGRISRVAKVTVVR